ncbi:MAG: hypothetical protein OXK80_05830 [Bdellovibrionales bacterium]|nr:hypothetical protein [Bdellovibrionales bacterium]
MLKNIFLFSLLCVSHFSYSAIYQTCKWSNQPLTDRFIQSNQEFLNADALEGNFLCNQTTYNTHSALQPVSDILSTSDPFLIGPIPPICFLSSMTKHSANYPPSRRSHRYYYHCNSPDDINPRNRIAVDNPSTGQTHQIYPRSPCISEDYHLSSVKVFNKMAHCFGLSERETKNLFAIINHESRFAPNAKSPTGARCAGQLTKPTVITLGMNILQESYPTFHLYNSAINRCPSLIDKTIPNDISDIRCTTKPCAHSHLQTGSYESKKEKLNKYPVTCKLTSDFSQCLFYTFLNFKTALDKFNQNFDYENEFEDQEISEGFIEKYGVGVNANEVIIAKKESSSDTGDQYLFTNAQSAYDEVQKYGHQDNNPMYNLDTKTVSLISIEDIEDFKFFATQLSYNGGNSIVRTQIKNFLTFLKEQIGQTDCSSPNNKYCKYRRQLFAGNSLDLNAIKEDFKSYLRQATHAKSGNRMYPREETFIYPDKIQESIDHFQNVDNLSRSYLQKLATNHLSTRKVSPETAQQIQNTVEDIKNQCQIQIP